MSIHLHTRSICDACRVARATVEIDSGFFLCDSCADIVITSVSVAPVDPLSGVRAAVTEIAPPNPPVAAAINSKSALEPARAAGTATGSDLADPPIPVAVNNSEVLPLAAGDVQPGARIGTRKGRPGTQILDFESEVTAIEAQWALAGVALNPIWIRDRAISAAPRNQLEQTAFGDHRHRNGEDQYRKASR